ncbi:MAG: hypothetical protein AAB647_02545 [Patescibacteria group bacterium]
MSNPENQSHPALDEVNKIYEKYQLNRLRQEQNRQELVDIAAMDPATLKEFMAKMKANPVYGIDILPKPDLALKTDWTDREYFSIKLAEMAVDRYFVAYVQTDEQSVFLDKDHLARVIYNYIIRSDQVSFDFRGQNRRFVILKKIAENIIDRIEQNLGNYHAISVIESTRDQFHYILNGRHLIEEDYLEIPEVLRLRADIVEQRHASDVEPHSLRDNEIEWLIREVMNEEDRKTK